MYEKIKDFMFQFFMGGVLPLVFFRVLPTNKYGYPEIENNWRYTGYEANFIMFCWFGKCFVQRISEVNYASRRVD